MYRISSIDIIKLIIFLIITDATIDFLKEKAVSHFAKTSLYEKARQVLRDKNLLILTGHPGEGKTAMAAHLALEGGTKKENCIKLESVRDWKDVDWSLRCFNTVIIDDIFGGISLDNERLREWKTVLNDIEQRATNKELRVIITSRRYIIEEAKYKMDKIKMFHETDGYIVHLDSRDLTPDEMKQILSTVLERNGIDKADVDVDVCVTEARGEHGEYNYWLRSKEKEECVFGFPECAILFATKEMLKDFKTGFFRKPELHFKSYIKHLYKPNKTDSFYMFIALVAVWAEQNHTIKKTDLKNPKNVSAHIRKVAKCFGITIDHEFVESVKFALDAYTGFLVLFNDDSGKYTFYHNVIGEMVGVVLGDNKPEECIKLCQRDFFIKRVTIDDARKRDLQVSIPERMYPDLCEKFIKLLTHQDCSEKQQSERDLISVDTPTETSTNKRIKVDLDILLHDAFEVSSFRECFTKHVVSKNLVFQPVKDKYCSFSYPLIVATCLGKLDSVKNLLKHGAHVNLQDNDGQTVLHHAAFRGHSDVMKELLDSKADVNARDNNSKTALHHAASRGHSDVMQMLLDRKADVNAIDDDGYTPLHCAAKNGHVNAVKTCLSNGADVNIVDTALHLAAYAGHSDVMQMLLDRKADVNAMDDDGYTPLHCAAKNGHVNAVKTCLSNGADVNTKIHDAASCEHSDEDSLDSEGYVKRKYNINKTALHLAAYYGHSEVMQVLLDNKADVNARDIDGTTPLHYAAYSGNLIAIKICLSYDEDVNIKNKDGDTALHCAARGGHSDVMKELLDRKADVNVTNNPSSKKTPLHCAAWRGHLNAVKTCLSYGADVKMTDAMEWTALHSAVVSGNSDVMKELLEKKADVNAKDYFGKSPLHDAAIAGHLNAVKTCLRYGADVNMQDRSKKTALHHAAYHDHSDVMKELLENEADVNAKESWGKTPLLLAANNENLIAVKICLSYGADVNTEDYESQIPIHYALAQLKVILTWYM